MCLEFALSVAWRKSFCLRQATACPLPRSQRAPFPDHSVPPSQTCCFLLAALLRQWTVSGTRRLSFHRYCTSMCAYSIQYLVGLFDYACAASPFKGNVALELKMYLLWMRLHTQFVWRNNTSSVSCQCPNGHLLLHAHLAKFAVSTPGFCWHGDVPHLAVKISNRLRHSFLQQAMRKTKRRGTLNLLYQHREHALLC